MRFDVITLFPDMFSGPLSESIVKRAQENNIVEFHFWNPRDFTKDKHGKVDDVPYGGGGGMLMTCQPLFDCIEAVKEVNAGPVVFMTAKGEVWNQTQAELFAQEDQDIILLCGHYEGIDQRVIDRYVDCQISLGHFVLTGGELPAMVFIDAVVRLLDGVIEKHSHLNDSFASQLRNTIEYPHYTRPAEFRDMKVPDVLLSGNHAAIEAWRKKHSRSIS